MMLDEIKKYIDIDYDHFKIALTHSSYINENSNDKSNDNIVESNERLEYLGDSVISYVVSQYLYKEYPTLSEGDLSKIRSEIVNQKSLSDYSKMLKLGKYLLLGKGEELNNGRKKTSNLCNLFEAIIGYMSINIGLEKTSNYLIELFKEKIQYIYTTKSYYDSKSLLQEKLQESAQDLPKYSSKKLNDGSFEVALHINNLLISKGYGRRKVEAEKNAAKDALNTYTKFLKDD
ncbi:MAG: ribonuclease III [Chloroflexi bacterium]|nr:ribonuclease III [Chloroflexota bacterium]RZP14011.1 MAG: ribonuclease III [Chloroflexota bacterium]